MDEQGIEINRTAILMGRMHKLENLQSKLVNLMDGVVFGGELPDDVKEGVKTEKFRTYAKAKIAKAERLKFIVALAVYDDLHK